jgi:hypothetical protein
MYTLRSEAANWPIRSKASGIAHAQRPSRERVSSNRVTSGYPQRLSTVVGVLNVMDPHISASELESVAAANSQLFPLRPLLGIDRVHSLIHDGIPRSGRHRTIGEAN